LSDLSKPNSVFYGTAEIAFSIRHAHRKTLAIHVFPDGTVVADAPHGASELEVAEKIRRKGAWILTQKHHFASYPPVIPARQYISGEGLSYLGRHYRLKVYEGHVRATKLIGAFLEISHLPLDGPEVVGSLVKGWLRDKAYVVFESLLSSCVDTTSKIGIHEIPPWSMLLMRKRWGSCTKAGKIILNPELIAAPKDCIRYVILHELCHLIVKNHSQDYYKTLSRVEPEWEKLRTKLNRAVELRLEY